MDIVNVIAIGCVAIWAAVPLLAIALCVKKGVFKQHPSCPPHHWRNSAAGLICDRCGRRPT